MGCTIVKMDFKCAGAWCLQSKQFQAIRFHLEYFSPVKMRGFYNYSPRSLQCFKKEKKEAKGWSCVVGYVVGNLLWPRIV